MFSLVLAVSLLAGRQPPPKPPPPAFSTMSDEALLALLRPALGAPKGGATRRIVARERGDLLTLTRGGAPGATSGLMVIADDVREESNEQMSNSDHAPTLLFVGHGKGKNAVLARLPLAPFKEWDDPGGGEKVVLELTAVDAAPNASVLSLRRLTTNGGELGGSQAETTTFHALRGRELVGVFEATTRDGEESFTDAEHGAWLSRGRRASTEVRVLATQTRGIFDLEVTERSESWENCPGRGICSGAERSRAGDDAEGPPDPVVDVAEPSSTRYCWDGTAYDPAACGGSGRRAR